MAREYGEPGLCIVHRTRGADGKQHMTWEYDPPNAEIIAVSREALDSLLQIAEREGAWVL